MENPFEEKFSNKSRQQLERIVANPAEYQPLAVQAANKLLENNGFTEIKPAAQTNPETALDANSASKGYSPFNTGLYFNTLSYRELITMIAMSTCMISLRTFYVFYRTEPWLENISENLVNIICLSLVLVGNHIFYRAEHGRSNNYIGRLINDIFQIIILLLIAWLNRLIFTGDFDFDNYYQSLQITMFIGVLVFCCLFELLVGFLAWILKLVKCPVL